MGSKEWEIKKKKKKKNGRWNSPHSVSSMKRGQSSPRIVFSNLRIVAESISQRNLVCLYESPRSVATIA